MSLEQKRQVYANYQMLLDNLVKQAQTFDESQICATMSDILDRIYSLLEVLD